MKISEYNDQFKAQKLYGNNEAHYIHTSCLF